ncbi:MAG: hypothetical protein LBI33_00245 [Propionibacteriaceae bacterium]|jgi:hypothetical protein|nr:hypothetical protein [Propionibacteriaceae bacterium]
MSAENVLAALIQSDCLEYGFIQRTWDVRVPVECRGIARDGSQYCARTGYAQDAPYFPYMQYYVDLLNVLTTRKEAIFEEMDALAGNGQSPYTYEFHGQQGTNFRPRRDGTFTLCVPDGAKGVREDFSANAVVEVVGTSYTDARQILSNVIRDGGGLWNVGGYQEHEIRLLLQAEPDNPYDGDAVLVMSEYPTPPKARVSRAGKIGYLPRGSGVVLNGPTPVDAIVKEGFGSFWVKIDLTQVT